MDRVTLGVFANHARAAAENMAYTLYRTAHSTFVKETEDFTVQILETGGRVAAVPLDFGATWYPGIDYAAAIGMIGAVAMVFVMIFLLRIFRSRD